MRKTLFLLASIMSVGLLAGCGNGTNSYPNDYNLTYRTSYYNMEKGSYHYSESYEYHFNFSNFVLLDCSKYQKNIASFDSLLTCDSYTGHSPIYVEKDGQYMNDFTGAYLAKQLDAIDIKFIDLADDEHEQDEDDLINMIFFHNDFTVLDKKYQVFTLLFRGTTGASEWKSNFDLGYDTPYYVDDNHPRSEWKNKDTHKGFDIAANRAATKFEEYFNNKKSDDATPILNITGHSRGSAVANVFAKKYNIFDAKTFAYTFASPNTTTELDEEKRECKGLFNIINTGDLVTYAPCHEIGFYRYGTDVEFHGLDLKDKFFTYFKQQAEYVESGYQGAIELMENMLVDITKVYLEPNIEDSISFETRVKALAFIQEHKEAVKEVNEDYNTCLILDETIYQDDDEYVVKFKKNRSLYLNVVGLIFDLNISTLIKIIPFIGEFLSEALIDASVILENGVNGVANGHYMHIYKLFVDQYQGVIE